MFESAKEAKVASVQGETGTNYAASKYARDTFAF